MSGSSLGSGGGRCGGGGSGSGPAGAASTTAAAAALRACASAGDVAGVARLLGTARCVRFSRDPESGRSALHLAASAGHAPVVRLLLNVAAPKEVDSPDGSGCTALQRAAADGHEEVLRLLLARGADVDKQDSVHGNSALHEAAWKGYSRSVRLLAAAGATLSRANAGGFTALHLCCQNGHNQSCRELLLAGCDPDIQNNYGDTALHTAARYGHAGVTRILISAQCRVSEQNKNGDTALHIAAAMGRRKLTRILLEAGCDKGVVNKQKETARDIATRKDLNEILTILDECGVVGVSGSGKKEKKSGKSGGKKKRKSKVRFDPKQTADTVNKPNHWSPYGCHYYPDPEAFPSPRLDSLPVEPLKRGEQYYLDLAGNICKGPVGVGYTCYCAPLFRHLEARLERDKRELQRAQVRLGQRVAGLEQRLNRGVHGRRSERAVTNREPVEAQLLPRSRSLEMLDKMEKSTLHATRSMDELDPPEDEEDDPEDQRPSVKELVARIQKQQIHHRHHQTDSCASANVTCSPPERGCGNNSESSDDEDSPLRMAQCRGPMGNSNLALASSLPNNYENLSHETGGAGPPRSRSGVYSPTIVNQALAAAAAAQADPGAHHYIEPIVKIQESNVRHNDNLVGSSSCGGQRPSPSISRMLDQDPRYHVADQNYRLQYSDKDVSGSSRFYDLRYAESPKYADLNSRFAKLRVLDPSKAGLEGTSRILDSNKMFESTTRMLENPQDTVDRDTNNDSGYSTKVYGSSKGNSPSLSGQIDNECLGASSLV